MISSWFLRVLTLNQTGSFSAVQAALMHISPKLDFISGSQFTEVAETHFCEAWYSPPKGLHWSTFLSIRSNRFHNVLPATPELPGPTSRFRRGSLCCLPAASLPVLSVLCSVPQFRGGERGVAFTPARFLLCASHLLIFSAVRKEVPFLSHWLFCQAAFGSGEQVLPCFLLRLRFGHDRLCR